jgi:hypothetical protein
LHRSPEMDQNKDKVNIMCTDCKSYVGQITEKKWLTIHGKTNNIHDHLTLREDTSNMIRIGEYLFVPSEYNEDKELACLCRKCLQEYIDAKRHGRTCEELIVVSCSMLKYIFYLLAAVCIAYTAVTLTK